MSEEEGGAPDTQPITVEVGTEIVNSVTNELVKAVALVYGVDPMTASSMGGAFGGAAKGLAARAQQAYERRRQRALVALGAAREESGLEREELLERALEDDRKLELLTRAVETAMREADERRVRFYGRIAASGVLAEDDAKVDASERIFSTIANLDTVDLKVLLHMTAREPAVARRRARRGARPSGPGRGPTRARGDARPGPLPAPRPRAADRSSREHVLWGRTRRLPVRPTLRRAAPPHGSRRRLSLPPRPGHTGDRAERGRPASCSGLLRVP